MGGGDVCEFSERATSDKLSENEDKQVIPVGKTPILCPVAEFGHNSAELPLWQKHCDLGENIVSCMHNDYLLVKQSNILVSNVGHKFYRTII